MPSDIIPNELVESKIFVFRGKKVMVDRDLATLYGVETRILNQAVRRNIKRFPEDFMFQLTDQELQNLRSQSVTSSLEHGGRRYVPYVFTEQGVAMLSSVLNSDRAIMVNIQIMRTFTRMREMLTENDELRRKIELLEKQYDEKFGIVFEAIRRLVDDSESEEKEIGFTY
ncbi:DNA-binding protein [Candidatus Uhrbacteria bacterium CG10_big_fil_rev_8_21_14_0_10_48_16]|uniref:DNA-binding protein n=1 Tax=Candidatus Uhrbacteria bacterium CG10_big_fil_rev_8_21_14_0_10_48_16 TaxID=1975038 RepID=A0A2M8LIF4_9BACT|nr:MAG: DNA-binding protein [Candidatus Uhrbacteria bacterium CG10_big_fil_rev_8_21_14_0_10_48_16]